MTNPTRQLEVLVGHVSADSTLAAERDLTNVPHAHQLPLILSREARRNYAVAV